MPLRKSILLFACLFNLLFVHCSIFDSDPEKIVSLGNRYMNAGTHAYSWDQKKTNGSSVKTGTYTAKMKCSGYKGSSDFKISSAAEHIPANLDSYFVPDTSETDTSNADSTGHHEVSVGIPQEYSLFTNANIYAIGDTVLILMNLPNATKVEVWIEK